MLPRRSLAILFAAVLPLAPARADDLTAQVMQGLAQVAQRHARFTEVKTLPGLEGPLISQGELFYRRPAHLEKITGSPYPEKLVVDGRWLTLTDAAGTPQVVDLDSQPDLRALIDSLRAPLAGDLATLRQVFSVRTESAAGGWRMILLPAVAGLDRFLRQVTVSGVADQITLIDILQANGGEQRMQIDPAP